MQRRYLCWVVALAAVTLSQACSRDGISGPAGVALSGNVHLQDAWGNDLDDFSGVAISLDGALTQAVTDKGGAWHIDDVPAGHHDITLTKATFGTMRIYGQDVAGPSTVAKTIFMSTTPTAQAIIDSIWVNTLSGTAFYFVDGHLSAPPPANSKLSATVLFVSKREGVSSDPAAYDQWYGSFDISGKQSTFTMLLPVDGTRASFGAGTQLFATAYATSATCSCYDDPATKNRVFSNAGPHANVVRFTVK